MAKIPVYSQQVSASGSLGPGAVARAPNVQDSTGDLFRGMGNVIGQLGDVYQKVESNRRATKLASLKAEAVGQLNEFAFQLETDTDFDTHYDRYRQKVEEITKTVRESTQGDDALYSLWQQDFKPVALDKSFAVRRNAIAGISSQQIASLDENLNTFSSLAGSDDPVQDEFARSSGLIAIQDAVESGVLTPEAGQQKAEQFRQDIVQASIRRDVILDPEAAEQRLIDGEYADLSGEQRQIWIERAASRAEGQMRKRGAEEERTYKLEQRAEAEMQEQASKEGDKLLAEGDMSAEWIEANRDTLSQGDYRYFYGQINGEGGRTDPIIYSDLRMRAGQGQDVRTEAREQLHQGSIKLDDYNRLLSLVESNSTAGQLSGWYKRGEEFIARSLKPSDLNYDPAAAQRHAAAMDDWYGWAQDNPTATSEVGAKEMRRIVEEYAIIDFQDITLVKRAPSYLVGSRNAPDLDSTEDATVAAFESGEISREEFEAQARLITEWRDAMSRMAKPRTTGNE